MSDSSANNYFLYRLFPLLSYCGLIFYLSSLEAGQLGTFYLFPGEDKIIHVMEYTFLGLLLMRSLSMENIQGFTPYFSIFLGTIYGMSDEYHQSFVPGREAAMEDVLADFLGVVLGSFFYQMRFREKS